MIRVLELAGVASDPAIAARLHQLEHRGGVETVRLARSDMSRRRQQLVTDGGTQLALMLARDAVLAHGSVLWLDETRAIVVALDEPSWLTLKAPNAASALALGYFAGNMHWKVRFEGDGLAIALEGPRSDYLQRLAHLMSQGVSVVEAAPRGRGDHGH